MDVTFLGTGSAFNPVMDNSNAYFLSSGTLFLVDCGETTFGRIWRSPAYTGCSEVAVLVTHLHADHVGSLGSLLSYSHYVAGKKVRVYHPLESVVRLLALLGIGSSCYEYRRLDTGREWDLGCGVKAEPVEVEHVPDMTCFGYIVSDGTERIYFSGDARTVPDRILRGLRDGSIDRIYQDTGARESDHPTHASIAYLEKVIPADLRSRVFCIHLDYDYRSLLEAKGFGTVYA